MAHGIPDEFRIEFSTNVEYAIQQMMSKYSKFLKVFNFKGKERTFTDIAPTDFIERNGRLQQTQLDEIQFNARKAIKRTFSKHFIFDHYDDEMLGELGRPDSETIGSLKAAWGRMLDNVIVQEALGSVMGGAFPHVTPIPLPASQEVASTYGGSGSHLIPQKILKAVSILEENELHPSAHECFIGITPLAKAKLIEAGAAGTNDFWGYQLQKWIENPSSKLFGLTPVEVTINEYDAQTDIDTILVWEKSSLQLGWDKLEIKIDERSDIEHSLQISAYGGASVLRRHEEGVVAIYCDRSP